MRRAMLTYSAGGEIDLPDLVAVGARSSYSTSISVAKPTGTAEDDLMIACIANGHETNPTAPSGWTLLVNRTTSRQLRVYGRFAGASEPSSYNWTSLLSINGSIATYRGLPVGSLSGSAVDVTSVAGGSGMNLIAPSVTTSATCWLVFVGFSQPNGVTVTAPAGMTGAQPTGGGGPTHLHAVEDIAVTGATGTRAAVASFSSDWAASLIAFPL